jgi:maleamate amidohydrolase
MEEEGIAVYQRQGFGKKLGFGVSPALLIIDFQNGFVAADVLGGGNIPRAVQNTVMLLAAARKVGIPVAYTRHAYAADKSNFGLFNEKLPGNNLFTVDSPNTEVVAELAPMPGEFVTDKQFPSAFFGTILGSWLAGRRVDTLIVAGCTTSGCVRASSVDATCYGFRPIVVRDCVGDRAAAPHEANLFDLQQKYADVISLDEALNHLDPKYYSNAG